MSCAERRAPSKTVRTRRGRRCVFIYCCLVWLVCASERERRELNAPCKRHREAPSKTTRRAAPDWARLRSVFGRARKVAVFWSTRSRSCENEFVMLATCFGRFLPNAVVCTTTGRACTRFCTRFHFRPNEPHSPDFKSTGHELFSAGWCFHQREPDSRTAGAVEAIADHRRRLQFQSWLLCLNHAIEPCLPRHRQIE